MGHPIAIETYDLARHPFAVFAFPSKSDRGSREHRIKNLYRVIEAFADFIQRDSHLPGLVSGHGALFLIWANTIGPLLSCPDHHGSSGEADKMSGSSPMVLNGESHERDFKTSERFLFDAPC
jgi:hypothetical protein